MSPSSGLKICYGVEKPKRYKEAVAAYFKVLYSYNRIETLSKIMENLSR
jgi:hypothetical protein